MGIKKDIKKYIKELQPYSLLKSDMVIKRLNEILANNKKEKTLKSVKREYIVVKSSGVDDEGDTLEAIKDGYGLPKTGFKYIKIKK